VKQDGVFYDDDLQEAGGNRHASGSSIVDQHSTLKPSLAAAADKAQDVYYDDDVGDGSGDGSGHGSKTAMEAAGFSPAEELFEELKARLEVKGAGRGRTAARCVTLRFTGTSLQAEIAEELRIYEQLHGASLQSVEQASASAQGTPAQDDVWGGGEGGAFAGEEGLTPSRLLGFDIAEV
jgi:hypothetical protein